MSNDTTTDDESGTAMETIARNELAASCDRVHLHSEVSTEQLPNPVGNYLRRRARFFEQLFQKLLGRDGEEIIKQDTIDSQPHERDRVALDVSLPLDGDEDTATYATVVAEQIEGMFFAEKEHYVAKYNDEDGDEPPMPDHLRFGL